MLKRLLFSLLLALSWATFARAVEPDEILSDTALEARARAISADLRCLVCQNQSIDDSSAPLARDLRLLVREQLKTGATDQAVVDYIVARYGEFVLLRPRWSPRTWLLWLGPLLLMAGVGFMLLKRSRAGGEATPVEAPLTSDEKQKLDKILRDS